MVREGSERSGRCGGGVLSLASDCEYCERVRVWCAMPRRPTDDEARRGVGPLPAPLACAFYARTGVQCNCVRAGGPPPRARGTSRADELQPTEEGARRCVRECARACEHTQPSVCVANAPLPNNNIEFKSAYKKCRRASRPFY